MPVERGTLLRLLLALLCIKPEALSQVLDPACVFPSGGTLVPECPCSRDKGVSSVSGVPFSIGSSQGLHTLLYPLEVFGPQKVWEPSLPYLLHQGWSATWCCHLADWAPLLAPS